MKYNFSSILQENDISINEFIDTYTSCIDLKGEEQNLPSKRYYTAIFTIFTREFHEEELLLLFEDLAQFKLSQEVPYIVVSNEIYSLENFIIANISSSKISSDEIIRSMQLFKHINNRIAQIYLIKYIDSLMSRNSIRQSSLSELVEKNIIQHYESHLIWLTSLAKHIKNNDTLNFPELNPSCCKFGLWLKGDAKKIIQNNSKYKSIVNIHKNLHTFADKIYNILRSGEYHILITYLEKCELMSLSIGTELALLDQILMNKAISKDTLTGSLNRNALKSVFESQYELSLATSNPFVLAMCDLDFFKIINDKYGHIAGDKMLKLFVQTVKKNIRNSDIILRYGGEEFVILLPTLTKDKGYQVLNNLRESFSQVLLDYEGNSISATVSIGMIEIRPTEVFKSSFIDEYVMIADKNLYIAKEEGRNRVHSY
ncbi:sensor domain-containing diguanylate cyclase [Sulfurimonas sp. SAG-AH-194-C20]|nr:sensor domain-containing diguanylate cyclase [Sulfurimonas sp. SAG-AH-194-C20]MDF1878643.1 sensor domain-containing diguanylate cyclase [Sulfurimonas sp. SAG-AH-194-C20]